MKIEIAKKLILVLLFILVITVGITLILIRNAEQENPSQDSGTTHEPADTSDHATTPDATPDSTDSTDSTDTSSVTTPPVTTPPVTTPPVTDPPTTTPPTTSAPDLAPEGFALSQTFQTDTGVRINLIAECHATRNHDGTVNLTVELYLDHRSLSMGPRNCVLTVGSVSQKFTTERINQETNAHTKLLLQTFSGTFSYGETVNIYAKVPTGLTNYGGVQIKNLIIDATLLLK